MLGKLHRGQVLHRDLTPMNVFVCDGHSLKLGDFGLVRQQSDRRGATADALNPMMAPSDIVAGAVPKWQSRDDVYQVGQLIGMLVRGDARARIRTGEIRLLPCSDQLKEIVYRCIGERRKRYETADELIEALRKPPASLKAGRLRTLKGVHLAFTGILSRPRREARAAARRAGAKVHGGPSARTSVVVRGRPNPRQAAGRDAGLKLMEIKRLRAKGHKITLLNERQFWRLAAARRALTRLPAAGYLKHCASSARPRPDLLPGTQVSPTGAQHQHASITSARPPFGITDSLTAPLVWLHAPPTPPELRITTRSPVRFT